METSLALLLSTGLLLGAAAAADTSGRSELGPILVKVVSVMPKPIFDGNQIEHWRHYRFRIVGTTASRSAQLEASRERLVDAFDRRDVPAPEDGAARDEPPSCPGTAAGDAIYLVQLEKVRTRQLLDGVAYVLDSCLRYDAGSAYGFALFDDN